MIAFGLPAFFSALIAIIHFVAGGREVVQPLLRQESLPANVALTHYYCWHMATISLTGLTGCFLYAAFSLDGRVLATFATLVAFAFFIWGLVLVVWKRQRHRDMPQWVLFLALTLSSIWAHSL